MTGDVHGQHMQIDHDKPWQYSRFRDVLKCHLYRLSCSNVEVIGTHSMRRSGTQFLLLLGVSMSSVFQRGFWSTYQRMETYLASYNRRELQGALLPAPKLLAYSTFSAVAMDRIEASLSCFCMPFPMKYACTSCFFMNTASEEVYQMACRKCLAPT